MTQGMDPAIVHWIPELALPFYTRDTVTEKSKKGGGA
jgi:hypothetical protein